MRNNISADKGGFVGKLHKTSVPTQATGLLDNRCTDATQRLGCGARGIESL